MKARGSGDENVLNKSFELVFNDGLSQEGAKDPSLPGRWQSGGSLGQGVGGPLFKKVHPPPQGKCP